MAALDEDTRVEETSVFGSFLHVSIPKTQDARSVITDVLEGHHIPVARIESITPSLEDVFIHLIDQETKEKTA
jgi:hypothetical protein